MNCLVCMVGVLNSGPHTLLTVPMLKLLPAAGLQWDIYRRIFHGGTSSQVNKQPSKEFEIVEHKSNTSKSREHLKNVNRQSSRPPGEKQVRGKTLVAQIHTKRQFRELSKSYKRPPLLGEGLEKRKKTGAKGTVIISCADPRITPEHFLGLNFGGEFYNNFFDSKIAM